jgi:hypothetical protein
VTNDANETSSYDEEQAVLATLQALLDALGARDKDAMRATLMPGGSATHSRDEKFFHESFRDLPDRLPPGTDTLEERIHDPLVRIDDDIAMVWAPYDFFVGEELHHWGTNIVSFLKRDGKWLVSGITDNGRTTPKPES